MLRLSFLWMRERNTKSCRFSKAVRLFWRTVAIPILATNPCPRVPPVHSDRRRLDSAIRPRATILITVKFLRSNCPLRVPVLMAVRPRLLPHQQILLARLEAYSKKQTYRLAQRFIRTFSDGSRVWTHPRISTRQHGFKHQTRQRLWLSRNRIWPRLWPYSRHIPTSHRQEINQPRTHKWMDYRISMLTCRYSDLSTANLTNRAQVLVIASSTPPLLVCGKVKGTRLSAEHCSGATTCSIRMNYLHCNVQLENSQLRISSV